MVKLEVWLYVAVIFSLSLQRAVSETGNIEAVNVL